MKAHVIPVPIPIDSVFAASQVAWVIVERYSSIDQIPSTPALSAAAAPSASS